MEPAEPVAEATWQELREVLDEEIASLPEKYRTPIVLCHFENKTNEQAAKDLRLPKSTLATRVQRGRELLRQRLLKRGVTLSTGALSAFLANKSLGAPVGAMLAVNTVKAAMSLAAGTALTGCISATALALAEEVVRTFAGIKAAIVISALALGLAVGGAGIVAYAGGGQGRPEEQYGSVSKFREAIVAVPLRPQTAAKEGQAVRTDAYGDPLPDGALARLGTIRFRQGGLVQAVAYSPDGKYLVAGGGVGMGLNLFDAVNGRPLRKIMVGLVSFKLAFSADSKLFVTDYGHVVDVATGQVTRQLFTERAGAVCFTPDGKTVVSARNDGQPPITHVLLSDVATRNEVRKFQVEANQTPRPDLRPDTALVLSPDAKNLASSSLDGTVWLWDMDTGKEFRRFAGNGKPVRSIAFAPDGTSLAVAGDDGSIAFRSLATGQLLKQLTADDGFPCDVVFSPDGKLLVSAAVNGTIRLWDTVTAKERHRWEKIGYGSQGYSRHIAFSSDSKVLALGGRRETGIRLLNTATGKDIDTVPSHTAVVRSLRFAPDGKTLMSLGDDLKALEWDLGTRQERRVLFDKSLDPSSSLWSWRPVDLSSDGSTMAMSIHKWAFDENKQSTLKHDPAIHVFDTASNKLVHLLQGHREDARFFDLKLSSDAKLLASGAEDGVRLWDLKTGKELRHFRARDLPFCAFSPNGTLLAYSGPDKTICIWDIAKGRELLHWDADASLLVFSPDGHSLASDGTVWSVQTGKLLRHLPWEGAYPQSLAFSPSGRIIAASLNNRHLALAGGKFNAAEGVVTTIRLIDSYSGQEIRRIVRTDWAERPLAFSGDGRVLAAGDGDSSILLWDVTYGLQEGNLKPVSVTKTQLEALWSDLAGPADKSDKAIWRLVATAKQSLPVLAERLKPVSAIPSEQAAKLVAGLDAKDFAIRQQAARELDDMGEAAEPALRKSLEANLPLEVRHRIEQILENRDQDMFRKVRAIEALEHIGTVDARDVLLELANRKPASRLADAASAALRRLAARQE
jgi:WD40 repeat protein